MLAGYVDLQPEQLLLCLDSAIYIVLATVLALIFTDDPLTPLLLFSAICIATNAKRHITASRAPCNADATSEGQLRRLPAALTAIESVAPRRRTLWPWLPTVALSLVAAGAAAELGESASRARVAGIVAVARNV